MITLQPVSQTIVEGQTVSFTVESFGCEGPLGFQWWDGWFKYNGITEIRMED